MTNQQPDFRRLRHVPIAAVLAARGVTLRQRGHRLVGACPVHGGDNQGAFTVDAERNLWFCFSRCQAGGDVIDLVVRLDRVGHREAGRRLAAFADASPLPPARPTATVRAACVFQPYTRALWLDPDSAFLRAKGIWQQTALHHQVGQYHGPGFLQGCVGVRLHDPQGNPLGYAGRRLDLAQAREQGKWKLPPRLPKSQLLYNLHRVRDHIEHWGVVILECPWAVLRLAQLGLPAVALLGVHMSDAQARLVAAAPRIVMLLDGDEAGRTAAEGIRHRIGARRCGVVHLPDGLDPDDLSDSELQALAAPLFSL